MMPVGSIVQLPEDFDGRWEDAAKEVPTRAGDGLNPECGTVVAPEKLGFIKEPTSPSLRLAVVRFLDKEIGFKELKEALEA